MMNIKIANLLANNLKNDKIITEMIMHIGITNEDIANRLITLCLGSDSEFVTKDILLKRMDKIKLLCMKYMSNIIDVDDIKIIYVDNIVGEAFVTFKAQVTAWFKNKESADKKESWYASSKLDDEHKFRDTYTTTCNTYISFKDIDLD